MKEQIISRLRQHWLGAATILVILPVVLPSKSFYALQGIIGFSTVSLFVLSFPIGLLLMPIAILESMVFGPAYFSIGGLFGNLVILFALGAVQWFWLIPRIFTGQRRFNESAVYFVPSSDPLLLEAVPMSSVPSRDESPLQALINDGEK